MSLLHIGLCLLLVVGMLTCLGRIFDLDWLFCLGVLFEFVGAVTMIMALIIAFFVNGKYDGVSNGKIKTYSECYKEHGQNVCEDVLNNKHIVQDYWIKNPSSSQVSGVSHAGCSMSIQSTVHMDWKCSKNKSYAKTICKV